MTFANLVRVHSRIARRQKALWYTSIPLTLFAVLVSFGGGRAPHTGGVEDIVYTAQIVAIFVGVAYAAAFTDLLAAPARLGVGELESSAPATPMTLRAARVTGPFAVVVVPPLVALLAMGAVQAAHGGGGSLPAALAVAASLVAPAVLCAMAISALAGSLLPQAFARVAAVLVWFYLVFSTPTIPVPAPEGTVFGVTGDAVATGYFDSRPLYPLTGPLSSAPGPVAASASLLWQLALAIALLAVASRLSDRLRDR